ncbi:MAG: symbB [Gammaproteobacteria bacterium]|jgi:hypothetical protein|nr:symbB [Gammaproteobacteria bacterium]
MRKALIFVSALLLAGYQHLSSAEVIVNAPKTQSFSGEVLQASTQIPKGSYRSTCFACTVKDGKLRCACDRLDGKQTISEITYQKCVSPEVNLQNCDGVLSCTPVCRPGIGANPVLPPGNYLQTCTMCKLSDKVLICTCAARDGSPKVSGINISTCHNTKNNLQNCNGKLMCVATCPDSVVPPPDVTPWRTT